jgi:hypothetical protein
LLPLGALFSGSFPEETVIQGREIHVFVPWQEKRVIGQRKLPL